MNLKTLFRTGQDVPAQQKTPEVNNPNNKQEGETYHRWGLRVCAITNGERYALMPYLHNVYNYIRREQIQNEELQRQQRQNIQNQIAQEQTRLGALQIDLSSCQQRQSDASNAIAALKEEKRELKNRAYEVNKEARIKLILGLVILIPLTFYLFLFYSSTFYSAFFKKFDSGDSVLNSMFDPNALSQALAASVFELSFVLCAPIIFMGLGFCLHFFSVQKSWKKFVKMGSILCITFIFDAILAYMIGRHLHQMSIIIGVLPIGSPYGIAEAVADINTWAVIFCGFIVYIIWGIVFDMAMSAYNQLDLNKVNIKAIDETIAEKERDIEKEKSNERSLRQQIAQKNNEISTLTAMLGNNVIIDNGAIRTEMNNFFSGWISQMSVLGMQDDDLQNAQAIFNQVIATVIPNQH